MGAMIQDFVHSFLKLLRKPAVLLVVACFAVNGFGQKAKPDKKLAQLEEPEGEVELPPEEGIPTPPPQEFLPEDYEDGVPQEGLNGAPIPDEIPGEPAPDYEELPPEQQSQPAEEPAEIQPPDETEPAAEPEIPEERPEPTPPSKQPRRLPPTRAQPPQEDRERPTPKAAETNDKKSPVKVKVNGREVPTNGTRTAQAPGEDKVGADLVPEGQELVNIDFPEPTDIKDIIRAVSLWTGKNVILGRDVSGKVQMISPRKVTKVEAYQAFLSALDLLGLTTVETGKVIKIIPVRSAVKSNLKTFLGSSWTPMTDEMITQIVPLKYVDAKEIQTKLSRIVSSNSMIAYEPTNTLIISDSGYKVRRILDIIQLLDVQTQQPKLSIVPIKYGDAKSIASMVADIFKTQSTGKRKSRGRSYLEYKIMTDERTNSVIIFGPPRTIADVKELVRKFDVRVIDPNRQASIHVRPLDYADAKKLASTLSALASGGSRSRVRRPPVRSSRSRNNNSSGPPPVASLDNDVKITADEASNSLIISGSRAAYDALNTIIRKLDIRKSQVFVEAEILDINVDGGFRFGTSVFAGWGKEKGTKVATTWDAPTLAPLIVAQTTESDDQATKRAAAGAFKDDLTIGILSGAEVTVPGLGKISPGALIKMIKTDSYTRVLSSPHILTANNETAQISVGDQLFYKTPVISDAGIVSEKVEKEPVELALELKPNISHSNYITMKIDLDASSGSISAETKLPNVLKRKSSQIVTVKNEQTVVISGLVQTTEIEVYKKIPLLGDIPILGWLFRNSSLQKKKNNLMIFLTPHIVHGANDLAAIYQKKIKERDEFLEKVYGSGFKDDDFYAGLPTADEGVYRADAYDVMDERTRERRRRERMQDMGYSDKEINEIEQRLEQNQNSSPGQPSQEPELDNDSESSDVERESESEPQQVSQKEEQEALKG